MIKQCIKNLSQYEVPQDASIVKLNQNESPIDIPQQLKDLVFEKLSDTSWNRYPDGSAEVLLRKIAHYTSFPHDGIMVANASNELIQTLIYATCDSGDSIVTITPGFSIYGRVAAVMNIRNIAVPLRGNFSFDVAGIIDASRNANLVIFASPNNPTGTAVSIEEIEILAESLDGMLAVDEAYFEFYKRSAQALINKYPNLVILRTFSKALRLAGARLGYMLGTPHTISLLRKARLPFSVGLFPQLAGEIMLDHAPMFLEVIDEIIKEREKMYGHLKSLNGIHPVESYANFILFSVENGDAKWLFRRLYDGGVLIRYFDDPLLRGVLRVTIGTPKENEQFMKTLREAMVR